MPVAIIRNTSAGWAFKTKHTQDALDINVNGQLADFVSAESVILCAGPAAYNSAGDVIPIGLCDSVSLQQQTNIIQLYELGSRLPYIIPGRTQGQLQLNRIVFNGDSLMGALTNHNGVATYEAAVTADSPGADFTNLTATGGTAPANTNGAFLLNLASSFFKKPFGLALLIQDSDVDSLGNTGAGQFVQGMYIESCLIQSHQMSVQAQQFIVMETATVRYTNMVPIAGLTPKVP